MGRHDPQYMGMLQPYLPFTLNPTSLSLERIKTSETSLREYVCIYIHSDLQFRTLFHVG